MTQPHTQDGNDLLMSGGIKAAKFDQLNVPVIGTILDQPKAVQLNKFGPDGKPTTELDYWPSGDPKMQVIVTIATDLRDPADPEDDGRRRLHIPPRMMPPVREAIQRSGAKGLAIGGRIAVCWISGTGQGQGNPKVYAAEYAPPAVDVGSMLATSPPAATPAAPPTAAAPRATSMLATSTPAVAASTPPASPTMTSMLAAPPAAQAGPPPGMDPAVWANLPEAQRAAVLAAMATTNQPPF